MLFLVLRQASLARFVSLARFLLCVAACLAANISQAAITESRSYDGTGNNQASPTQGSVGTPLLRMAPPSYPDGMGDELVDWPNARTIVTHQRNSDGER